MAAVESLKRVRRARGLSLADVAARTGLFREAIARLERPHTDPRASSLVLLARAYGVPICELFKDGGHEHRRRGRRRK